MGVSGLLVGLAGRRKIPAASLLAETYAHPQHLGLRSAKEILEILNEKLHLKLHLKELNKEIDEIEKSDPSQATTRIKKLKRATQTPRDINYIG